MKDILPWLPVCGIAAGIGVFFWLFGRWMDRSAAIPSNDWVAGRRAEWERERQEHRAFLERAVPMRAKVLSKVELGQVNLRPNLEIRLRVLAPAGEYEVEVQHSLDYEHPHRFPEGSTVDVLVDPDNRERVVLC